MNLPFDLMANGTPATRMPPPARGASSQLPAVWFPTIRVGTGVDVFTERLCQGLQRENIRAEITWLPRRAEHLPWSVRLPECPGWANVVHVNTWLHKRFVPDGISVVATAHHCVHDADLAPYKSKLQTLYHRYRVKPTEQWILDRADSVTAVSRYTAHRTQDVFGISPVRIIHNGIPDVRHSCDLDREPQKRFRLLYVGTWSRRKGADLLGPIMRELGNGFELQYTSQPGKGRDLPSNCHSLGRPDSDELQHAYCEADALLFPTRLEGFGQVALEAMAHGLPVISTGCSALPEVVLDGTTGFLCPKDDVKAYAAAARRLKDDPPLWRLMRIASLRHSRKPAFGIDEMVKGYLSVYESLLKSRDVPAEVEEPAANLDGAQ